MGIEEKKNQGALTISCSLDKILGFLVLSWGILLYPVGQYHTSTLLAFGFPPINLENQLLGIIGLSLIAVVSYKLLPSVKIEVSHGIFYASSGYILPIMGFLISVDELAILLFLASVLPIAFGIERFTMGCSDFKLQIIAIGLYVVQIGIFFLIFFIFCHGAENLIISSLLCTTYAMCILTLIMESLASANLICEGEPRIKVEQIFSKTWIICIVISSVFLIIKGKGVILLYKLVILSVCGWMCFKLCNYLKHKPNQEKKESGKNASNNGI